MKKLRPETDVRELKLDPWQQRVLRKKGNVVMTCGRQTGKSTIVALKTYTLATEHPGTTTLVIAASQRQSSLLFEKIRYMFDTDNLKKINFKKLDGESITNYRKRQQEASIYETEPTLTRIKLKNGSNVYCVPTGKTGAYIRGFTVDFLIADEAAQIADEVWVAVNPMMATSKKERKTGWTILLGTPYGKRGYFYEATMDKEFLFVNVPSTKCKRISKKFLAREKRRLTKIQFAQEYLAQFVEEFDQYFPTELINKCNKIPKIETPKEKGKYYLGVDVARFGGDSNAFFIVELVENETRGVYFETTEMKSLVDTCGRIENLNQSWNFKRIFIDGTGVGGGVVDFLKERLGKKKVIELNNSSRPLNTGEETDKNKTILKEDLYSNLKVEMERGRFTFVNDWKVRSSLSCTTFEYKENGRLIIKGRNQHIVEAIVRAMWCLKMKGLDLFLY